MYKICPLCGERITEKDQRNGNVETISSPEERGGIIFTVSKPYHKKCRRITK